MFDSASSGYRRLNRNGNSPTKNVFFFGILIVLVVIFSVFYLYISAVNDASALRIEFSSQSDFLTKLKNEVLGLNVKLEESKNTELLCKESQSTVEQQNKECSKNLKDVSNIVQSVNAELAVLKAKNEELLAILKAQKMNMSAMQTVGVGQEAMVIKLNETVDALRRDLILKDEIIKKLEISQNKKVLAEPEINSLNSRNEQNEIAQPPNLQRPSNVTVTKSVGIMPPPVVEEHAPDVLAMPHNAQIGDRVKIEEANQKRDNDGSLLQVAAQQQDVNVFGLNPPMAQAESVKLSEI